MARSRNRRRRQGVIIVVALVVSATVFVFAHDIHRYAHASPTQRASLNRSFRDLSANLLTQENRWGISVAKTLSMGPTLSRTQLSTRLDQFRLNGDQFVDQARILESPMIHGEVQATLIQVTNERVSAVDHLIGLLAGPLDLPQGAPSAPVDAIQSVIARSNQQWRLVRTSLRDQPGHVTLVRSHLALSTAPLNAEIAAIISAPSLAPTRSAGIAAVRVSPAPLPSTRGLLHLLPTTHVTLSVAVINHQWIIQHLTVSIILRPTNGIGRVESVSISLITAPAAAGAVNFPPLRVQPGERATLSVSLSGTPAIASSRVRTYQVVIAPS